MATQVRFRYILIFMVLLVSQMGCSELNEAATEVVVENLTYTNNMKEIFDANCIQCHFGDTPPAGYVMTSYAGVITRATAGDSNSVLISVSVEGGSMHSFYDSQAEIYKVVQWVVEDGLAE